MLFEVSACCCMVAAGFVSSLPSSHIQSPLYQISSVPNCFSHPLLPTCSLSLLWSPLCLLPTPPSWPTKLWFSLLPLLRPFRVGIPIHLEIRLSQTIDTIERNPITHDFPPAQIIFFPCIRFISRHWHVNKSSLHLHSHWSETFSRIGLCSIRNHNARGRNSTRTFNYMQFFSITGWTKKTQAYTWIWSSSWDGLSRLIK